MAEPLAALGQSADPNALAYRSALLPLGRTNAGGLTWAVPQAVLSALGAVQYPGQVYRGEASVYDPATGRISDEAVGKAFDLAGTAMTGGLGGVAKQAGETALGAGPIRAFHGSPHSFDRFDISKIGSGEGAQAFGHGLYFAENETVAKAYRDALKPGRGMTPRDKAARWLERYGDDADAARAGIREHMNRAYKQNDLAAVDDLRAINGQLYDPQKLRGQMYEVAIDADPAKMLDYDAPLGEQAKALQDLVRASPTMQWMRGDAAPILDRLQADPRWRGTWDEDRTWMHARKAYPTRDDYDIQPLADQIEQYIKAEGPKPSLSGSTGEALLSNLEVSHGSVGASKLLHEAGVPGVRYWDAGSRGAEEGSRNYVLFSDDIVSILRKYGLAGAVGAGGALGALGTSDAAQAGSQAPLSALGR